MKRTKHKGYITCYNNETITVEIPLQPKTFISLDYQYANTIPRSITITDSRSIIENPNFNMWYSIEVNNGRIVEMVPVEEISKVISI